MATRRKTYYTADETTNNLFTTGKQWMTADRVEYKGAYHKYLTGEVFTGATWNGKTSQALFLYESPAENKEITLYRTLKPNINTLYDEPKSASATITKTNIDSGVVRRYFYKKYDNEKVFETDIKTYENIQKNFIDKKLYVIASIDWFITGEKQDTTFRGAYIAGVITKNSRQIKQVSKTLPGISDILTDPLQYYTDTDFIAPVDINGLDS
jgi:hypothetical protein